MVISFASILSPTGVDPAGPVSSAAIAAPNFSPSRILTLFLAQTVSSRDRPLAEALLQLCRQDLGPENLSDALNGLSEDERRRLRQFLGASLCSLELISREQNPRLFAQTFFHLARRWVDGDQIEMGGLAFSLLAEASENFDFPVTDALREQARAALTTLRGEGPLAEQVAFYSRGLIRQSFDGWSLAAFGVGVLGGSLVRYRALNGLLNTRTVNLMTRGSGAYLAAATAAWAVESSLFWGIHEGLHELLQPSGRFDGISGILRSLASTGISFGFLKVGGGLTRGLTNLAFRAHPLSGRVISESLLTRLSLPVFHGIGVVGGIYGDQWLQSNWGWMPEMDGNGRLAYALSSFGHLTVGNWVASRLLGGSFHRALADLERRTQQEIFRFPPRPNAGGMVRALSEALGMDVTPALAAGGAGMVDRILTMSEGVGERGPRRRVSSGGGKRRGSSRLSELLDNPELVPSQFSELNPAEVQALARRSFENGTWLRWILHWEARGETPRQVKSPTEALATALNRLGELERGFDRFHHARNEGQSDASRLAAFQQWQRETLPPDEMALGRMMRIAKRLGIEEFFGGAWELRRHSINLKSKVRTHPTIGEYFYDLYLIREFLRGEGLRTTDANLNGLRLSQLLNEGEGNCVTLSLLFAHLANRIGRRVKFGVLPNHLFLVPEYNAAIESTMDFGILVRSAYEARILPPERIPFDPHVMAGFHLTNMGKFMRRSGEIELGERTLRASAEFLSNNPRPWHELAEIYLQQGNFEQAWTAYQRIQALYPTRFHEDRVEVFGHLAEGDWVRGERGLKRLNSLNSEDPQVLLALYQLYRRQGRAREAAQIHDILEWMSE